MDIEEILMPTETEVVSWLIETAQHSLNFEYYMQCLKEDSFFPYHDIFGVSDAQRPMHDMMGEGNKLVWEVIRGLALEKRLGIDTPYKEEIEKTFFSSRLLHREGQTHHRYNGNTIITPETFPQLSAQEILYHRYTRALDIICCNLEGRIFDKKSLNEIANSIENNPQVKEDAFFLTRYMRKYEPLDLSKISSLSDIFSKKPYEQIPDTYYDILRKRVGEAIADLNQNHGYNIKI
jgi:hypothetical protein